MSQTTEELTLGEKRVTSFLKKKRILIITDKNCLTNTIVTTQDILNSSYMKTLTGLLKPLTKITHGKPNSFHTYD